LAAILNVTAVHQFTPKRASRKTFRIQSFYIQSLARGGFGKYITMTGNAMRKGNGIDLNMLVCPFFKWFAGI
jgi:hypothetical protein